MLFEQLPSRDFVMPVPQLMLCLTVWCVLHVVQLALQCMQVHAGTASLTRRPVILCSPQEFKRYAWLIVACLAGVYYSVPVFTG